MSGRAETRRPAAGRLADAAHVAAVLALVLLPALAEAQIARPGIPGYDRIPAKFDRPFEGILLEHDVPLSRVAETCRKFNIYKHSGQDLLLGCSRRATEAKAPHRPVCAIVYSSPSTRRHELAHCLGWRHP